MIQALTVITDELKSIGVPHAFMTWTDPVQYPYFVSEYTEAPPTAEDGGKEATVILTGTTRGTWLELEQFREKIERHFDPTYGLRTDVENGAVAIYYENAFPVPTGEAELKRMQINLQVKIWKGMM